MFKIKGERSMSQGQRSRSQRKVMYQEQKRYNTAMDTLGSATSNLAWAS